MLATTASQNINHRLEVAAPDDWRCWADYAVLHWSAFLSAQAISADALTAVAPAALYLLYCRISKCMDSLQSEPAFISCQVLAA